MSPLDFLNQSIIDLNFELAQLKVQRMQVKSNSVAHLAEQCKQDHLVDPDLIHVHS